MRTISVKQREYDVIEDYINASLIQAHLTFRDVYDRYEATETVINRASDVCYALNLVLAEILSTEQFNAFREAVAEAEANETLTL